MRTYDSDDKGKLQAVRSCESDSTNAEYRGGTTRSSDEVSVIEMERRGCIIQFLKLPNRYREELNDKSKII